MRRLRSVGLLLVALALLGLGWSLAPRTAPPIYDGVGFPDEPYRFVVQPIGAAATKPPTTATSSTAVSKGTVGALHASSAEQAPQVDILVPVGRLHAPSGTTRVVVRATPVQPVDPSGTGYLWSNVYDIASPNGAVTMTDGTPAATITLRAATAQRPMPAIERYVNGGWTKLTTLAAGTDIYQANLPGFGRYAVVGSKKIDVSQLRSGGAKASASPAGKIIAAVSVLVVVALFVIGAQRRTRARRARQQGPSPDDQGSIP